MTLHESHSRWRDKLIESVTPRHNWVESNLWCTHGVTGCGPKYLVKVSHPPTWHYSDADFGPPQIDDDKKEVDQEVVHGILKHPEHIEKSVRDEPTGMYVTLHRDSPEDKGHTVLLLKQNDGTHKITGGHPFWQGLRLSGVLPDAMFTALAKHRHKQYHENLELQNIVKQSLAPQLTADKEPEHPNPRCHTIIPPTEEQAIVLAKLIRSSLPDEDKNRFTDVCTNLEGAKLDWCKNFIKEHPDEAKVIIVGNDDNREHLKQEFGAAHDAGIVSSDEPNTYVLKDHPPNSQKPYHVCNYDQPVSKVAYLPHLLSHHDLLLDTLKERKRLPENDE